VKSEKSTNQQIIKSTNQQINKSTNIYPMEFEKSVSFNLAGSVDYADNATVSKMVIKRQTGNITLFAFDKGQSLSEHSAPFDAYVQVI
jgi:quercetin dioxygenase-like cupin family protein